MIILLALPMPISVNDSTMNNPRKGGRGRIKTKAYRDYEKAMEVYRLANLAQVNEAKWEIMRQTLNGKVLHLEYEFWFHAHKIICQGPKIQGKPKRNDTANRLKCLDDQLATILQVDDSYFWSGSFDKKALSFSDTPEQVKVTITFRSVY
jgi:hypothetical protein